MTAQLDTSIPLSVKKPELGDITNPFTRIQSIRANDMAMQRNQQAMDDEDKTREEDDAVRSALGQYPDDPDKAVEVLTRTGRGTAAIKLQGMIFDQRKKFADTRISHINEMKAGLDVVGNAAVNIKQLPPERRAAAWNAFRTKVTDTLGENLARFVPEQFDESALDQAIVESGKMNDLLQSQERATKAAADAIELDRKGLESSDLWKRSMADAFSTADSQEAWDQLYRQYAGAGPVAKTVLTQYFPSRATFQVQGPNGVETQAFGPAYSPEAQKAMAQIAMTPDQRADNARADASAKAADAQRRESNARANARDARAAERDKKSEEEYPGAVKSFLNRLPMQVKNRKGAIDLVKQKWPEWIVAFPNIDRTKVNATIDALFGKEPTGIGALLEEDNTLDDAMPTPTQRKPVPGLFDENGKQIYAESTDGGKTWKRVQ